MLPPNSEPAPVQASSDQSSEVMPRELGDHGRRQLNILTLTPFYPAKTDDASGCFVAEPLRVLAKVGVKQSIFVVTPFYRTNPSSHRDTPPASNVRYPSIPGGWGLASAGGFLFARLLGRVRSLHQRSPITLIHAHGPLPAAHAAMLLKRELGIPYVVSVHGLDAYSRRQVPGLPGQWCQRMSRLVYDSADRVICISERVREQVLEGTHSAKTKVVYNGADPELFSPETDNAAKGPAGSDAESLRILSIGNLIPIKGHELLIRAMAELSNKYHALRCDIVGDGPLREMLSALARELGIGDRVSFLGRRCRKEVADLMRASTLFVLPSSYEGLGCVYLEAMASEKVAVGCRGQGIEEVIRHGNNGWLVAPNNLTDLTNGLARLLENSQLRSFIAREGRETVLRDFTIEHQARRLLRVYEECTQ